MILYAESSAVASWLLGEPPGEAMRQLLDAASEVFASDLTLVESDRAIHWAFASGRIEAVDAREARDRLETETLLWNVWRVDKEITNGARRRFPREPIRAMDAIHLATVLVIRGLHPDLLILSLDRRVRENAAALGFELLPAGG